MTAEQRERFIAELLKTPWYQTRIAEWEELVAAYPVIGEMVRYPERFEKEQQEPIRALDLMIPEAQFLPEM